MRQFTIKSEGSTEGSAPSLLELIDETEGGYYVRIVHRHDDWEDVREDFLSQELFDTCIRTGYIAEMTA